MTSDRCVLDDVRAWLGRFINPANPEDLDKVTLWVATALFPNEVWYSPRLLIQASGPGSGKSTLLSHIEKLLGQRAWTLSQNTSSSVIMRRVSSRKPVVLIDEANLWVKNNNDVKAMLNMYERDRSIHVVNMPDGNGGWTPTELDLYTPVAMTGNGSFLDPDTRQRCIDVTLKSDIGAVEETAWEVHTDEIMPLHKELIRWADSVRSSVGGKQNIPVMPEGVRGRSRQIWESLVRVATQASPYWDQKARDFAVEHAELAAQRLADAKEEEGSQPHMRVIHHIREVWPINAEYLPTAGLIVKLKSVHPYDWGPSQQFRDGLTSRALWAMLERHGVKRSANRLPDENGNRVRCIALKDLTPAFESVGIDPPARLRVV